MNGGVLSVVSRNHFYRRARRARETLFFSLCCNVLILSGSRAARRLLSACCVTLLQASRVSTYAQFYINILTNFLMLNESLSRNYTYKKWKMCDNKQQPKNEETFKQKSYMPFSYDTLEGHMSLVQEAMDPYGLRYGTQCMKM